MTREEFRARLEQGPLLGDGANGSNLMKAGMPKASAQKNGSASIPR